MYTCTDYTYAYSYQVFVIRCYQGAVMTEIKKQIVFKLQYTMYKYI